MDSGNSPDDLGQNQHLKEHIIEGERMNERKEETVASLKALKSSSN